MKPVTTLLFILSALVACSQSRIYKYNKKHFSNKNYFYMIINNTGVVDANGNPVSSELQIVHPSRSFWGSLKEDGAQVIIKTDSRDIEANGAIQWEVIERMPIPHPTGGTLPYASQMYFPEVFYPTTTINEQARANSKYVYRKLQNVKYRDYKFVLQAMTIPLKFRKAVNDLPYTTETGVNVAFGTGLKWSYNWYAANKSFLGQKTNSFSMTPGLLLGLGAADIVGGTTAPVGFKNRKEPILAYGGFFMFGFNTINIGFVIGKDAALRDGSKSDGWVYDNKTWTGIAIALDIIK